MNVSVELRTKLAEMLRDRWVELKSRNTQQSRSFYPYVYHQIGSISPKALEGLLHSELPLPALDQLITRDAVTAAVRCEVGAFIEHFAQCMEMECNIKARHLDGPGPCRAVYYTDEFHPDNMLFVQLCYKPEEGMIHGYRAYMDCQPSPRWEAMYHQAVEGCRTYQCRSAVLTDYTDWVIIQLNEELDLPEFTIATFDDILPENGHQTIRELIVEMLAEELYNLSISRAINDKQS